MIEPRREVQAVADSLIVSGTIFLVAGSIAVVWPEPTLIPALIGVGLTSAAAGVYQLSCGFSVRRTERGWFLIVMHGVLLILFGLLTEGVTALSFMPAMVIVAGWMFFYAVHSWAVALFVAKRRLTRHAATLWGGVHVLGALLLAVFSVGTMLGVLFLGAIYAAALGVWMTVGGYWIRREITAGTSR